MKIWLFLRVIPGLHCEMMIVANNPKRTRFHPGIICQMADPLISKPNHGNSKQLNPRIDIISYVSRQGQWSFSCPVADTSHGVFKTGGGKIPGELPYKGRDTCQKFWKEHPRTCFVGVAWNFSSPESGHYLYHGTLYPVIFFQLKILISNCEGLGTSL